MPISTESRTAWWMRLFTAVWLCLGCTTASQAQDGPAAGEYEIKAAFILNFAKFAEWPSGKFAATNSPMVLGVLGEDPFGGSLDAVLKDKSISGRPVRLERFRSIAEARNAHVVFIGTSDKRRAAQQVAALAGAGVMTIGQSEDFAELGGMIGFKTVSNRVRFEINTKTAERENIKISSKLLSLATKIWK